MLPNCVDGSAASEREVSKNIGQESQFGSTVGLFLLQYELLADQRRRSDGFSLDSLDTPFVESVEMTWKDWS